MPELPEVEVVRRGLEPLLLGRRIADIESDGLPLRAPVPMTALGRWACGARVTRVGRRAKYLLWHLDNGALVLLHLGMTGKIYPAAAQEPPRKHDHLCFRLDRGEAGVEEIRFNDCRRFGLVAVATPAEAAAPPLLAGLGPEPLDAKAFSPAYLAAYCRDRQTPIKNLLMDNRAVVGIGNIYANETLFAARVSPFAPAGDLSRAACQRIVVAARQILHKAIAAGGTTIADFTNAAGEFGYFQVQLRVYGRANQPCLRCGGLIERRMQGGRPTFFCPACQGREMGTDLKSVPISLPWQKKR